MAQRSGAGQLILSKGTSAAGRGFMGSTGLQLLTALASRRVLFPAKERERSWSQGAHPKCPQRQRAAGSDAEVRCCPALSAQGSGSIPAEHGTSRPAPGKPDCISGKLQRASSRPRRARAPLLGAFPKLRAAHPPQLGARDGGWKSQEKRGCLGGSPVVSAQGVLFCSSRGQQQGWESKKLIRGVPEQRATPLLWNQAEGWGCPVWRREGSREI